jgi:hypothetical protein
VEHDFAEAKFLTSARIDPANTDSQAICRADVLFFQLDERKISLPIMPGKPLPQFVAPMQASSVKKPFDSRDWIFAFTVRARSDHGAT